jgi:hypothetical protein
MISVSPMAMGISKYPSISETVPLRMPVFTTCPNGMGLPLTALTIWKWIVEVESFDCWVNAAVPTRMNSKIWGIVFKSFVFRYPKFIRMFGIIRNLRALLS